MGELEPQDKYLDINELRFHYLDWGGQGKQPMLLLHGFMGHAHVWDAFALEFRNRYHVIALDQRGHGESDWSRNLAYSIDDHFSDICGFAESLGLDGMILVGHSMGGRNALLYAGCFPEKVKRLVVVDSRPLDTERSSNALKEMLMHFPLQADALEHVIESILRLYPLLTPDIACHMARYGYGQTKEGKYVPKYDARMSLQCRKSSYSAESLWAFVSNISCPALIVRGEKSPFLSREDAKQLLAHLPRGFLREVGHSTHMPVQENPEEFKAAVWDFLNSAE